MAKAVRIEGWLRRGLILAAGVALIAGCRGMSNVMPSVTLPAALPAGSTYAGAMGEATLEIQLPEKFAQAATSRYKLQFVDFNQSRNLRVFYAGIGIDGWQPAVIPATTLADGTANGFFTTVGNSRVARFEHVPVPAGLRRLIRADLMDGYGRVMTSQWGVGDVAVLPPGAPTTHPASVIEVTPYTTPTAEIFRNLINTGDAAKTLTVPIADVQGMVDRLLDMDTTASPDAAFDGNLDGATSPVHPALLNTYPATVAVANGARDASGVYMPYTVPTPVPSPTADAGWPLDLHPTPVRQATVVIQVIDSNGLPVAKPCLSYVSDLVSPIQTYNGTGSASDKLVFFPVAIGNHRAVVVDTTTGRTASVPINDLKDKETRTVTVALPFSGIQKALGAYDLSTERGYGYNGNPVHHSIAYLNQPTQMAIRNGVLYFADIGKNMIRGVKLESANVGGYGLPPADTMVFDVVGGEFNKHTDLTFDRSGALLYSEKKTTPSVSVRVWRQALNPDGTAAGAPTPLIDTKNVLGWPTDAAIGGLAYDNDGASGTIYLGQAGGGMICEVDMSIYTLTETNVSLTGTRVIATDATTGSIAQRRVLTDPNEEADYYTGGPDPASRVYNTEDNFLFYSRKETLNYTEGDPPVAGTVEINSLVRRDLPPVKGMSDPGTVTILVGNSSLYTVERYGPTEVLDFEYTVPGQNYFGASAFEDLTLDRAGNLYFLGKAPSGARDFKNYNNVMRVTDVMKGRAADAVKPWWVSLLDVRGKQGLPKSHPNTWPELPEHVFGLGVNPDMLPGAVVPDLYVSGLAAVASPNGYLCGTCNNEVYEQSLTRYVHAISRVHL